MSTYNTGNLVPSMDPRDLDDNATAFDRLVTGTEDFVPDRLGVLRRTWKRMEEDVEGRALGGSVVCPGANGGTGVATQVFTSLALSNSWVVISTRRAGYRKITDSLVYLEIQIQSGTATDGTAICTPLPAGFRPPYPIAIPVRSGPNTTPSPSVSGPRIVIGTDGSIVCNNCSSAPGISFTAVFSTI